MEVQWIIVTVLIVLIIIALLVGIFAWMRRPQVSVVRPVSGEDVVVVGKGSPRVGTMPPPSRVSHGSSSPVTYRQILGQPA